MTEQELEALIDMVDDPEVVGVVSLLIANALSERASSIHVEPDNEGCWVRYRVDGILREVQRLPKPLDEQVKARMKIMGSTGIVEQRVPQFGSMILEDRGQSYALKLSTLPCSFGEKVLWQIYPENLLGRTLGEFGLSPQNLVRVTGCLDRPAGLFLIVGDSHSGRTSLLYSFMQHLKRQERHVVSIEDPVRSKLAGVSQVNVNVRAGLTFPVVVRTAMKQDADVIVIGRSDDEVTARLSVESALAGALVISAAYGQDAAWAVSRLWEMGVEPFMVATALNGVLTQRLARRLCPYCKEPTVAPEEFVQWLPEGQASTFKALGCTQCVEGYWGRCGFHEVLLASESVRNVILRRGSGGQLRGAARDEGMVRLWEDGMAKALAGETSLDECLRVIPER